MSKDKLQSLGSKSTADSNTARRRRNLTALLPIGLLVGFLAVFAIIFGPRLLPATEVETVPVVTVRSEATDPGTAIPTPGGRGQMLFRATGWVEPDPYITFVPTLTNGVVKEVHVLEGQAVKKGDVLARLIDDDAKLVLQQAERKLETIRARIAAHCSQVPSLTAELDAARKNAAAEKARLDELEDAARRLARLPAGTVPALEVEQARLQANRQRALLAAAEADIPRLEAKLATVDYERIAMGNLAHEINNEIAVAQLALDRTTITAPMDGSVLHLHAAPGKKRMLNMDDPKSAVIVELYDPENLQARLDVPLNEAASLAVGQPVELVCDLLPDTSFSGTVTRITGEADIPKKTIEAKVRIHDPDPRLRPAMEVRGKFFQPSGGSGGATSSSGRHQIFAPTEALLDVQGASARAWVAADGHAELRTVTLGSAEKEGHRHVTEGLRSGEHLILPPHDTLKEGSRISETLPRN